MLIRVLSFALFLFLSLFIFSAQVLAAEEFELQPSQISSNIENVIELELPAEISGFYVRPNVDIGNTLIWDDSSNIWVSDNVAWTQLPQSGDSLRIKIANPANEVNLHLLLQNKDSFEVFQTDSVKIYTNVSKQDYVLKLNQNIENWIKSDVKLQTQEVPLPEVPTGITFEKVKNAIFLLIGGVFVLNT